MESNCHSNSPECCCPCNCGCQNDEKGMELPFYTKLKGTPIQVGKLGICASCAAGDHEIPPGDCHRLDNLIELHQSVLAQLQCERAAKAEETAEGEDKPDSHEVYDPYRRKVIRYGSIAVCRAYIREAGTGLQLRKIKV
jgi:hypothetical protein